MFLVKKSLESQNFQAALPILKFVSQLPIQNFNFLCSVQHNVLGDQRISKMCIIINVV